MTNGRPDEIDIKLLDILQKDAAMDIASLAKLVHRSSSPVHERLKKFRQEGYSKGYIAVVDRAMIGQPVLAVVHVKFKRQTKKPFEF